MPRLLPVSACPPIFYIAAYLFVFLGVIFPVVGFGVGLGLAILFIDWLGGWPALIALVLGAIALAILVVPQARRVISLIDRRRNTRLDLFGKRSVAEHLEPLKLPVST